MATKDDTALRNIKLTDRDREVLHQVALHRFMESLQIQKVIHPDFLGTKNGKQATEWEYTNMMKRLKLLVEHNYLHLPPSQPEFTKRKPGGGSFPLVYGLGSKGALELRKEPAKYKIENLNKFSVNTDNKVSEPYLLHTVMTTEVTVGLMKGCTDNGLIFRDESEMIRTLSLKGRETIRNGARGWWIPAYPPLIPERTGIIPDRMCCMQVLQKAQDGNLLFFFIEADRGTETLKPEIFSRSSPIKKYRQYRATAKQQLLENHFALINQFTVLMVTSRPKRAQNILTACQAVDGGWKNFWITDINTYKNTPLMEVPWQKGNDGTIITLESRLRAILASVPSP